MNILFITLLDIRSVDEHNIYADLMREFAKNNHNIFIVSPAERRCGLKTQLISNDNDELHKHVHILKLKTGNIQKTNIIEKGISTVLLEYQIQRGIKKYLADIHFELVLYSTPPITIEKPISYIINRDGAKTYLLLKDIFPQNAVDIGLMSKDGWKGLLYKYFRSKEKKLYALSDKIGCMSPANVEYILKHNLEIPVDKVEVCPNCIEPRDIDITVEERIEMRKKYGIPLDKKVFVYGGNLGKPQDILFIIECLKTQEQNHNAFFLIVGDGTEFSKLENYFNDVKPLNMKLMKWLPKDDYDRMIATCDIGFIFLDHRFTIPNFPSRLLSYMQAGLPVLACTDHNTDIGKIIVDGGFGWWCESNSTEEFSKCINLSLKSDLGKMAAAGNRYLINKYSVNVCYEAISRVMRGK